MQENPSQWLWGRVLWGVPIIAVIWFLALFNEQSRIEIDLKHRSELAFRQAGLDWANVGMTGREASLIGVAYSEQERKLARRLLTNTWGIAQIADRSDLAAIQEHYVWTAAVDDQAVRLMGFYPNGQTHKDVLSVARRMFPQRQVSDQMRPARGAPKDDVWLGAIQFGLAQLTRLERGGRVNLRGTELAVAGVATSVGAYRTIKGALYRNVPAGVVLVKDKVEPPRVAPYTWTAEYKNGQLLLGGHIPSEGDRDAMIAAAKTAFKQSAIIDKMAVAAGQPASWLAASLTVIRQLALLQEGKAIINDTKLTIVGMAVRQETAEKVGAQLRSGMAEAYKIQPTIKFREATIPTVSPFLTTIVFDGSRIRITGNTPSQALTERIIATARKTRPKAVITNDMTLAKGAPEGWLNCTLAGLQGVLKLENGRVEVVDRKLLLAGLTKNEEIGEALPRQVRAAANRACTETVRLKIEIPPEPNLQWRAIHNEKILRLTGEVPDSSIEKSLTALAKKLFPKSKMIIDLRVNPARSKKWPKVAAMAIELLAKLRRGAAEIDGQFLVLTGEATDTAAASAIREQLKAGIAKGYRAEANVQIKSAAMLWAEREARRKAQEAADAAAKRRAEIERNKREAEEAARKQAEKEAAARRARAEEVARKAEEANRKAAEDARLRREREARLAAEEAARIARKNEEERKAEVAARLVLERQRERCQKAFDETIRDGTIVFERGSADIESRSFPTLDRLVGLHAKCASSQIEISGHTDSSGIESRNQDLSERRAQSVMAYLVKNGLPPDRVIARGYGETRPLVPNTTAANRSRNRRIEFKVKLN